MPVYLDNSATTRVCPEAAAKVMDAMLEHYGNPSSLYSMGVEAELILKEARENVAAALSVDTREICFTSGGTEANNLAVLGAAHALRRRGRRVVTTAIEHSSIERAMDELEKEGFDVVRLYPRPDGAIAAEDIYNAVTEDTVLVSIMLVNNETGAVQPVKAAHEAVKKAGAPALVHCDAVQAFCKLKILPQKLGVDLMSVSSHKIHGPKGAGALYIRRGARILPVLYGGGQENGLRSGTEPVPAIAGFGEAARIAQEKRDETAKLAGKLKEYCIDRFSGMEGVYLNSPHGCEKCAPHILNISVSGIRSETMLHFLESKEIYVSSGSACSRGAQSPVLKAMKLDDARVDSAIRISFSRYNTENDARMLTKAVEDGMKKLARSKTNA